MSSQPAQPPTLLNTFTTFLTVTLHSILYHRQLYDPSLFLAAKKYNIPVRQCRHPELCNWIDDCIAQIAELMADPTAGVDAVNVVVFSPPPEEKPLERFVVDVGGLLKGELGKELREEERKEVENQFRAAVGKVCVACERMGELPEGCTFTVAVDAREDLEERIPRKARRLEKEGRAAIAPSQGRTTSSSQKGRELQTVQFGDGLGSMVVSIQESKRKQIYYATTQLETQVEEDPDVTA
ncbi:DNA-binding protein [Ascobolus immersus RN42]|uniref:DNA-binding protein n=1 Tax=Ascobolus immersus RN42 TaxID=1160509 RepID=A0A3N4IUR0_ASCIM|nr:DNA-binding protein [Ascobolus immersus RN42]